MREKEIQNNKDFNNLNRVLLFFVHSFLCFTKNYIFFFVYLYKSLSLSRYKGILLFLISKHSLLCFAFIMYIIPVIRFFDDVDLI
jgi:hypothetical protein